MAITLFKYGSEASEQALNGARQAAMKVVEAAPTEMIMVERALTGLGYDGVTISFHKDYRSYIQYKSWVSQNNARAFLVNLGDDIYYRPITFSTLAKHLLELDGREATGSKKKDKV